MCAVKAVGRPASSWTFNYHDLAKITGKSVNAIQASKRRPGGFDENDILSVALWIARNAPAETKLQFLRHCTEIEVLDAAKRKRRKASGPVD